jgi:hypothetical protein
LDTNQQPPAALVGVMVGVLVNVAVGVQPEYSRLISSIWMVMEPVWLLSWNWIPVAAARAAAFVVGVALV